MHLKRTLYGGKEKTKYRIIIAGNYVKYPVQVSEQYDPV
jgi:hypothetical protein